MFVRLGDEPSSSKNKKHAGKVFAHWQVQMKDRFERLFDVMDRAGVVVGSEKDLSERGYEGETLRESINAIRAVDKAFILSSGVDDVNERVEELIHQFTGSLGASQVQDAHSLLSQGQYDDASRTAAFARTQARQAIASAEAKEASIRRKKEAETRRRRAASARLSSSSSSSSFGSSSSSSSSSGFSSSSFSSGSGFSRSGW